MALPERLLAERIASKRATANESAPVIPWDQFKGDIFRWRQGEHVALIGPTGSGKTTLSMSLLPYRRYVVALATKPKDSTMDALKDSGYKVISKWEKMPVDLYPRRILWPDAKTLYAVRRQRYEFRTALSKIYKEGGWCVYADELWFLIHHLKLEFEVRTYLLQARSLGISFVAATQRPAYVPLEIYDQSTHLFFFRDNDERNLKRLSGISWLSAENVRYLVAHLEKFQCLYINTRTGRMYRTTATEGG